MIYLSISISKTHYIEMATIAIPIETLVREFDGKLLLSCELASAGHKVLIGDRPKIRSNIGKSIFPDLYLSKEVWEIRNDEFSRWKNNGTSIAFLDAEGGVFSSEESYLNRVNTSTLKNIDLYLAWGENVADIVCERTSLSREEIFVTGNPRFDLLHKNKRKIYSANADELRSQFGKYLLMNTNFAAINHDDDSILEKNIELFDLKNTDKRAQYESLLIDKFVKSADKLSQLSGLDTVIIRPHPSENFDFYKRKFENNSSVLVKHSGDVRGWIMGSQVVLHNSCTTGIESALLNKPVIAFEPETRLEDDIRPPLPNAVSKSVTTVGELINEVQNYLNGSEPYVLTDKQEEELRMFFANVKKPATSKVVKKINHVVDDSTTSYPTPPLIQQAKNWIKQQPIAPIISKFKNTNSKQDRHRKQKFPGLSTDEVRSRLEDFNQITETDELTVTRINHLDDVFCIVMK